MRYKISIVHDGVESSREMLRKAGFSKIIPRFSIDRQNSQKVYGWTAEGSECDVLALKLQANVTSIMPIFNS